MIRENALNPSHTDRKNSRENLKKKKKKCDGETVIAVLQHISSKWLLFLKHLLISASGLSPVSSCLIALEANQVKYKHINA